MARKEPAGTATSTSIRVAGAARSHVNSPFTTTAASPAGAAGRGLCDAHKRNSLTGHAGTTDETTCVVIYTSPPITKAGWLNEMQGNEMQTCM